MPNIDRLTDHEPKEEWKDIHGWTAEKLTDAKKKILEAAPDREKIENLLELGEEIGKPFKTWTPTLESYDSTQFKSWEDAFGAVEAGKTGVGLGIAGEILKKKDNCYLLMQDKISGFEIPHEVIDTAKKKDLL